MKRTTIGTRLRGAVAGLAAVGVLVGIVAASPATAATPSSITVAGTFGSEIGCDGDWSTTCPQAGLQKRSDGTWARTITIPAGSFSYKVAVNGSWSESYGADGVAGGKNIPLVVPAGGKAITFVYNPQTHRVATNALVVTAAGTFQSELGCEADWSPDCSKSNLSDPEADGTYTWSTTAIPAGTWEVKATIGATWNEAYGAGGLATGANIAFTVPSNGATTTFSYVASTHLLTVATGAGSGTPPTPAPASGTTLGANYSAAATTFRIWSPDNSDVTVTVGGKTHTMKPVALAGYSDVYQAVVSGNLHKAEYKFSVAGKPVRDPYAQMVVPKTTTGIVIDAGAVKPSSGERAARPALVNREDAVVYELSVRDFTIDASSGVDEAKRGKFMGLVQTGTVNGSVTTGIDHLKELGVNVVQLMPAFDFEPIVPNWGYAPVNYNVPEEQFSQFTDPEDRIREFKDMVDAYHRNGIRVVMDVVYNHTSSKAVLDPITSKYYTRDDLSATGNSLDDGNPMVDRMMMDSLRTWVDDYGIDGFRFDLLGVAYVDNVARWGSTLNAEFPDRNLLLYGEPWNGAADDALEAQKVRYGTTPKLADARIGVFNGAFRDAIKGGNRDRALGYMAGTGDANKVADGTRGSLVKTKSRSPLSDLWDPAFAVDPEQTINYVSAHDDLSLWDKVNYSGLGGGANGQAGQVSRFAAGVVLTSQGIPFMTEGDEFLRTKVVGDDWETAKDSYEGSDAVNAIHWGDKVNNISTFRYYQDLIALRKARSSLRLTTWDAINAQVSTTVSGSVIVSRSSSDTNAPTAYDTVVVLNPGTGTYEVSLPAGSWTKVFDASGAVSAGGTSCAGGSVTVFERR